MNHRRLGFVFPPKQADCLSLRNHYWDATAQTCNVCPALATKRFAAFWETYEDGCDVYARTAGKYITHVYWSFAPIDPNSGSLALSLQGTDQTLKTCVMMLRQNCIKSLVSIGGADNRQAFFSLSDPKKLANFQASASQLVKKYNLDGLDIDDETGNVLVPGGSWWTYSNKNVLNYVRAIRKAYTQVPLQPSEPPLVLTWTEFTYSARDKRECDDPRRDWFRCYNDGITPLVDWVNIMAYNFGNIGEHDSFVTSELPSKWSKKLPADKIVIGGCRGRVGSRGGCSYGTTPTDKQLQAYAQAGKNYGGAMLWTGSGDYRESAGAATKLMGAAGGFAHP